MTNLTGGKGDGKLARVVLLELTLPVFEEYLLRLVELLDLIGASVALRLIKDPVRIMGVAI